MRIKSATNRTKPAPLIYRESLLKPGAIRIALEGRLHPATEYCPEWRSAVNPFLGGSAEEACIFRGEAAAREEIASLLASGSARSIATWEFQMLRGDGLWLGCVAAGSFE